MCKPKMLNLKTPEGISKIREIVKTGRMSLHQFNSLDTCYRLEIVKDFTVAEIEIMFVNLSRNTFNVFDLIGDDLNELRENGMDDYSVLQCGLLLVLAKGKCDEELIKEYRKDRKLLNKTLKKPVAGGNKALKELLIKEEFLLTVSIDMDPITAFIGLVYENLEMEIKEKVVLISEILNRLGIYELSSFLTEKEAEEHLERMNKKAVAKGEVVDKYQNGKDIIYDRIKYYLKKYKKMKSLIKKS